jgi:hypothetical protein
MDQSASLLHDVIYRVADDLRLLGVHPLLCTLRGVQGHLLLSDKDAAAAVKYLASKGVHATIELVPGCVLVTFDIT